MNKGLTIRTGQTHVNRWTDDLLRRIEEGQIDPSFVITHTVGLEQGPEMYKTFRDKQDGCIKVVLKPVRRACACSGYAAASAPDDSAHAARARPRLVQHRRSGWPSCSAPEAVARCSAWSGTPALIRAYGLREIAAGVGILTQSDPDALGVGPGRAATRSTSRRWPRA